MIGDASASDLPGAASVQNGMAQLNAITVGDARQCKLGQEASRSVLLGMQAAEAAAAFRQLGEQVAVVVPEPKCVALRNAVCADLAELREAFAAAVARLRGKPEALLAGIPEVGYV